MNPMMGFDKSPKRVGGLMLVLVLGCYHHARRDAPAPPSQSASQPMVSIPAQLFTMGDRNGEPDEYPVREIRMDSFSIDRMEVSNEAYERCVQAKACDPSPYHDEPELGLPHHPVVGVAFEDAERFCAWVSKRLPTEAEWELAARGTDQRRWPWKGVFDPQRANTSQQGDFHKITAPVDAYPNGESPYGVLNMAGNVAEWTSDFYDPTYYQTSTEAQNPTGPRFGRERVVRGGSYRDSSHLVRVSARRGKIPTESDNTIGFRCAHDG